MTTVTINIPDSNLDILSDITDLVKSVGGSISLPKKSAAINSLKQGLKESILISRGEMDGNPISTLWDE